MIQALIGIKPEYADEVSHVLNIILADEFLLYAKTRNAHWNIVGPDFYSKHKFFESQFRQLDETMDEVAERIRTIGHYSVATLSSFLSLTHLTERNMEKNSSDSFIRELLADHESIIIHLRENINRFANKWHDGGTSDFITGLMEAHEKMAWMLRGHLI